MRKDNIENNEKSGNDDVCKKCMRMFAFPVKAQTLDTRCLISSGAGVSIYYTRLHLAAAVEA
jgi:hypothetical protein